MPNVSASGEGWLTGWDYRQGITITGSSGAGTNYQVKLDVTYDANMQTDFDDLRVTTEDGVTLLDHWIESFITGTSAVVWVEVADNLNTTQIIYMYHGNVGATDASNGVATFPFFDDFDDASINTTLWDTTWLDGGSVVEAGGIITVDGTDGAQSLGAKVEFGTGYAYEYLAKVDEQNTVTLGADERSTDGTFDGGSYDTADLMFSTVKKWRTSEEGVQDTDARAEDYSTYQRLTIARNAVTDTRFFIGGVLKHTMNTEIPDEDMGVMVYITGASSEAFMNWTFVRKYIVVEPVAMFGIWQEVGEAPLLFNVPFEMWGYNSGLIILGLCMIPASMLYLAYGVKHDRSSDRLFYGLILFFMGCGLFIGGIMP